MYAREVLWNCGIRASVFEEVWIEVVEENWPAEVASCTRERVKEEVPAGLSGEALVEFQ